MWKSDEWQLFLLKCDDYPKEDAVIDGKFLAEQKLGPLQFNSLIEMYERDLKFFKQCFSKFSLGNLIRFINGLKSYVSKNEDKSSTFSKTVEASDAFPPIKKMRHTYDISLVNPCYSSWFDEARKFMFYFNDNENPENRRCATAFAPSFAVTYAHSTNLTLSAPKKDENGKIIESGSVFKVYSFDIDGQEKRKEISVQVVNKNIVQDYIILEALNGATFFDSNKPHILKRPAIGTKFICLGLSSLLKPHPIEGMVMATKLKQKNFKYRGFMLADCVVWSGDRGGGLFNKENELLGIVHADLGKARTLFVPANIIEGAWKFLTES